MPTFIVRLTGQQLEAMREVVKQLNGENAAAKRAVADICEAFENAEEEANGD